MYVNISFEVEAKMLRLEQYKLRPMRRTQMGSINFRR
jgi:hypothetical protein